MISQMLHVLIALFKISKVELGGTYSQKHRKELNINEQLPAYQKDILSDMTV